MMEKVKRKKKKEDIKITNNKEKSMIKGSLCEK